MARIAFYFASIVLIISGSSLSCQSGYCDQRNFYRIYKTRFEDKKMEADFVVVDLELKKKIFLNLCFSDSIKKALIVEYRESTQSYYSRGLLFCYDNLKLYYFKIADNKVRVGNGLGGNLDLNKILTKVKSHFLSEKERMRKNYDDVFDSPVVNIVLYDSSLPYKFDGFDFPIVRW